MAKHNRNEPAHTEHVRTIRYPNGNQGFSERPLGGDTVPGPMKGAPLSTKVEQVVTSTKVEKDGMNPFNKYEGNKPGVLGGAIIRQDAPAHDSPVPGHAAKPDFAIHSKAGQVAHSEREYGPENDFPGEGVMHRD